MAATDKKRSVNFREFRKNLSGYLRQARRGESFVVTSRGEEVARVLPPSAPPLDRASLVGLFKDRLHVSADFDDTPSDLIDAMESGG